MGNRKVQRNLSLIVNAGIYPWSGFLDGNEWLILLLVRLRFHQEQCGCAITGNYYYRILTNIYTIFLSILIWGYAKCMLNVYGYVFSYIC